MKRRALLCFSMLLLLGCSENFGLPPIPVLEVVPVVGEGSPGPFLPRAAQGLHADIRGRLWLATDQGIYLVDNLNASGGPRLTPAHPGVRGEDGTVVFAPLSNFGSTGERVLLVARVGQDDFLSLSEDAGRSFALVELPDVLARTVDALSTVGGEFLLRQGAATWKGDGRGDWIALDAPVGVDAWSILQADLIAARKDSEWTLLRASGDSLVATGARLGAEPLAIGGGENSWVAVTADSLLRPGQRQALPFKIVEADLTGDAGGLGLLGRAGTDSLLQWDGMQAPIVHRVEAGLATGGLVAAQGWALSPDASLLRLGPTANALTAFPFRGGAMDAGAMQQVDDRLIVGLRSGEVFLRSLGDSLRSVGSPLQQSRLWALAGDPFAAGDLFAGSFGAYHRIAGQAGWMTRNNGLFNYRLDCFGCPVVARCLQAFDGPTPELWLGSVDGNGPWRMRDGVNWQRVHEGLGLSGTRDGEDGLPFATQFLGFARAEGMAWAATFRGGIWRLNGEDNWEQQNLGLPDLAGVPVDSCCVDTVDQEVDARDLVALNDGTLLAATAWGIFRRPAGSTAWEPSMDGLRNGDIWALAMHPTRPDWILAGARGSVDNPDILFLSRDRGQRWQRVGTRLGAGFILEIAFSDPARDRAVLLLEGEGAWELELRP